MFDMPPDLLDLITPHYKIVEPEFAYVFEGKMIPLIIRDYWLDVQVFNKTELHVHSWGYIKQQHPNEPMDYFRFQFYRARVATALWRINRFFDNWVDARTRWNLEPTDPKLLLKRKTLAICEHDEILLATGFINTQHKRRKNFVPTNLG